MIGSSQKRRMQSRRPRGVDILRMVETAQHTDERPSQKRRWVVRRFGAPTCRHDVRHDRDPAPRRGRRWPASLDAVRPPRV